MSHFKLFITLYYFIITDFVYLLPAQVRLEENETKLQAEHEQRLHELTELNRLTARRLADSESKCTALQSSKLI